MGSSFLPSELNAAYLWAQIEALQDIQHKRIHIWQRYDSLLRKPLQENSPIHLPELPSYATNNGHMYYPVCPSLDYRTRLMQWLKDNGVQATFHYLPLHSSTYYKERYQGPALIHCDRYADCLVRLPLYYELTDEEIDKIAALIIDFVKQNQQV
jgi:dTDP-4-amino-4,6-dideoxygalactose transaminase